MHARSLSPFRTHGVDPLSFTSSITHPLCLHCDCWLQVSAAKRRYEVGLEKLDFTASQVSIMQDDLTALKPVLIKTVAETERLMATVSKEKTEVRGRSHGFVQRGGVERRCLGYVGWEYVEPR